MKCFLARIGEFPFTMLLAAAVVFWAGSPSYAQAREKVATTDCVPLGNTGLYVGVQPPVVSLGDYQRPSLVIRTEGFTSKRACDARDVKALVHKNESAVLLHGDIASMTVEGDLCAAVPKLIFYDARELRDIFGMHGSSLEPMARRIAAALAITTKVCGAQPEELRFVARKLEPQRGASFEHTDFYSGRLFPLKSARLVSDDGEQEKAYWASEDRRFDAAEEALRAREMRLAIGAAAGMILLGGAVTVCDPTDPSPSDPVCRLR